ncbi:hypothetical protein PR202_ga17878 [Eleusine coracana subsp. coracana]|uniref:Photosystem I reaction center subunit III n=1 Tax=Eleusine coracana subsp. coracana TaxID=191504 RepID=A0AAV5CRJ9_ELECO|nr:hypothetical protein PR202_ga17878 [Eleusine coracana subsp. coracana]
MASLAAASTAAFATAKPRARLSVSCSASGNSNNHATTATTSTSSNVVSLAASSVKTFSAALALSSVLLSSAATSPPPAAADIAGLTPCKESKAAPALAINATIEKTKRRFDNYGKFGLLCGADGLPHLIVSGDQRHWGEFITPGLLFLYIAGWIGWVGRSYLIAIRGEKKPAMREIIIDVELATRLLPRGFIWPVAAYRELINGELVVKDADIGYY